QDLPVEDVAEQQLEVGGRHGLLEVQGGPPVAVDDAGVQLRGFHELPLVGGAFLLPAAAGGSRQAAALTGVDGVGGRLPRGAVGHVGENVENIGGHRRVSPQ